ncbi:substrate-binding domain-containing protein [Actinoallomurus purpureus]|uniref:substrate-binding domain-containing protein n=1 Tax=Actinoallomurus purpureus TaxID=478114 RepID=UPI002092C6A1|nr:substrate-binding domain-containing protein [Actinoallomurus purpureus]MCO6011298.1 substrate-binding domain-containing protein [Actinoallomurus purpureus]
MARTRTVGGALIAIAVALGLTACSSGKESTSPNASKKVSGKISIAYLQKQGDQQYFIDEAQGAQAKAKQLGNVDVKVVNLGNDTNKAVSETQAAIAQKATGVIIVPPDPAVGPQIVQTAAAAKVALLSSDDQICKNGTDPSKCPKDQLVPRVGFSGTQMGTQVGQRAGEEFKKAGWKAADTAIIAAWKQDVTVCTDRVVAAQTAFEQAAGTKVRVVKVGTDNTPPDAQTKTAAAVSGNRSVKHWVVWGCNDENVSGAVNAIQNAGYKAADIDGVGLGAYLACKDWGSGKQTGMKAALFINGYDVGGLAVQTMVDYLRGGKAMPQEAFAPTKMVDPTNWQQSGVKCT